MKKANSFFFLHLADDALFADVRQLEDHSTLITFKIEPASKQRLEMLVIPKKKGYFVVEYSLINDIYLACKETSNPIPQIAVIGVVCQIANQVLVEQESEEFA